MDTKKKQQREYHVSTHDSPAWEEVEKKRADMDTGRHPDKTREPMSAPKNDEHHGQVRK